MFFKKYIYIFFFFAVNYRTGSIKAFKFMGTTFDSVSRSSSDSGCRHIRGTSS